MKRIIYFLPGPVPMYPGIKEAFLEDLYSHRSERFKMEMNFLKESLCMMTKSKFVQILSGSGTLSNDVIALQLRNLGKGIVLSNGEFGDRLIDHARRSNFNFETFKIEDGKDFCLYELETKIVLSGSIEWVWFVHSETSTGILNDLNGISEIGEKYNLKIAVDCMSSIGNVELDLSKVWMASASSNKGLGSFPGISFVFYNNESFEQHSNVPVYMDLGNYILRDGVPFTISTQGIAALNKSLTYISDDHFENLMMLSAYLERELGKLGFTIIGKGSNRNPAVFTIELPPHLNSFELGIYLLKNHGLYLSFESDHLKNKNRLQISLMGNHQIEEVNFLLENLKVVSKSLLYKYQFIFN
jgi:aspartate aminotransferase-like enzyme